MFEERKNIFIGAGIGVAVLLILVLGYFFFFGAKKTEAVALTVWQTEDSEETYKAVVDTLNKDKKTALSYSVNVVKKDPATYNQELLNALAEDKGPDIFSLNNDEIKYNLEKLAPSPSLTEKKFTESFVKVTQDDLVQSGSVYGVPLDLKPLALYYNKKMLSTVKSERPKENIELPKTWVEFVELSNKTKKVDGSGTVSRAGFAGGTASSTEYGFDIASLLMLQYGTTMTNEEQTKALFNVPTIDNAGKSFYPGTSALELYSGFGNPKALNHTFNEQIASARDYFISGNALFWAGYPNDYNYLKTNINNKFEIGVLQTPQYKLGEETYFLKYSSLAVSKKSAHQKEAWDFLTRLSGKDGSKIFFKEKSTLTKNPVITPVSGLSSYGTDFDKFEKEATAKNPTNWYKADPAKMKEVFIKMISALNQGTPAQNAVDSGAEEATKVLQKAQE